MNDITNEDYSFAERNNQDNWVVHLKTGRYADTYYAYDRVRLHLPEDADLDDPDVDATLSFNYTIIESPQDLDELAADEEFNNHIGDVLGHILRDSFEKGDYKVGNKDGEN